MKSRKIIFTYILGFYVGTGLLSVVGPNFASIPAASAVIKNMYASGFCPTNVLEDGTIQNLPCPNAWGAILGTCKAHYFFVAKISFSNK